MPRMKKKICIILIDIARTVARGSWSNRTLEFKSEEDGNEMQKFKWHHQFLLLYLLFIIHSGDCLKIKHLIRLGGGVGFL